MKIIESHVGRDHFAVPQAEEALAAALLHDIGHGPFSHSFEKVGAQIGDGFTKHEEVSNRLILDSEITEILNNYRHAFADQVASIVCADVPENIYASVVSSQFDADRLDYMQRDRLMTGTQHGRIDLTWLEANLEIGRVSFGAAETKVGDVETFVLGPKAIYAAEAYISGLFQLYPTVYFHKATRCAEKIFMSLLLRINSIIKEGKTKPTGLPSSHPIISFLRRPNQLSNSLRLDDTVIWGALPLLAEAEDNRVSELANMLHNRKLLKCIDIRENIVEKSRPNLHQEEVDQKVHFATLRMQNWLDTARGKEERIIIDSGERLPYRKYEEDSVPLNKIMIRSGDKLVDIRTISPAVDAIKPFRMCRAYIRRDDHEAEDFISKEVLG